MLPSNYKACNILEMRQLLETWYDRCTFAVATWRGDAQRYWLTEILDRARNRHDQWLQSTPSQRASLEPAYILGGTGGGGVAVVALEELDYGLSSLLEFLLHTWNSSS